MYCYTYIIIKLIKYYSYCFFLVLDQYTGFLSLTEIFNISVWTAINENNKCKINTQIAFTVEFTEAETTFL